MLRVEALQYYNHIIAVNYTPLDILHDIWLTELQQNVIKHCSIALVTFLSGGSRSILKAESKKGLSNL